MKNELFIPLIIFALMLVFGIICLMVYLSDGNAYWIKKKLKIGALLLTFSWVASSCDRQEATCYKTILFNTIWIDKPSGSLAYSLKDTMKISISNPSYQYYSFEIKNEKMKPYNSGILRLNDKTKSNNNYFLLFTDEFTPGKYKINFYG